LPRRLDFILRGGRLNEIVANIDAKPTPQSYLSFPSILLLH